EATEESESIAADAEERSDVTSAGDAGAEPDHDVASIVEAGNEPTFHPHLEQPAGISHSELHDENKAAIALPKGFAAADLPREPEPQAPAVRLTWFQRL